MVRSSSRGPVTLVPGYTLNYGQLTFILASALNYLSILSLFLLQMQNYLNNCRIFQKISPLQIVLLSLFYLLQGMNKQRNLLFVLTSPCCTGSLIKLCMQKRKKLVIFKFIILWSRSVEQKGITVVSLISIE